MCAHHQLSALFDLDLDRLLERDLEAPLSLAAAAALSPPCPLVLSSGVRDLERDFDLERDLEPPRSRDRERDLDLSLDPPRDLERERDLERDPPRPPPPPPRFSS